jgi:hypothetical protein
MGEGVLIFWPANLDVCLYKIIICNLPNTDMVSYGYLELVIIQRFQILPMQIWVTKIMYG